MKTKNKTFLIFTIIIAVLVAISIGLVAFNAIVLKNTPVEYKEYYVAKADIPSYTELSSNMFEKVSVPADTDLKGLVENMADASGKYNSAFINAGEYLTTSKITTDNSEEGLIYTMEINAAYVADVAYDDLVDIYALNSDNSVTLMYGKKKIYKAKTSAISTEENPAGYGYEAASKMYLHVTKNEMIKYYSSLRDHKLIILPYNEALVGDEDISNVISGQSTTEIITSDTVSSFDYTAAEGDTFEIIADNFQVDINVLKGINPTVNQIVEGDIIKIPNN